MPPRSRDFSVSLKRDFLSESLNPETGVWSPTGDGTQVSRSASLVVVNPWRAKKPASLIENPTPRTLTYRTVTHPIGVTTRRDLRNGRQYRFTGTHAGTQPAFQAGTKSVRPQLLNEAIIDGLQRLKDQKWNAGVAVAESSGLARMLTDAVRTATRARRSLLDGDLKKAYNRFRKDTKYMSYPAWRKKYWNQVKNVGSVRKNARIPSGWLYYHYGLKPTINDIDSAMQDFLLGAQKNPDYFRGTVQGYASSKQMFTTQKLSPYSPVMVSYHKNLESVRVIMPVRPKDNTFVNRLSQLGATNVPEAAWNGTPFSFVVDYLYSVGDVLSVLDTHVAWSFDDVIECYRDLKTVKTVPTFGPATVHMNVSKGRETSKSINRKIHIPVYGPIGMILPMRKRGGLSAMTISKLLSLMATGFKQTVRP